MSRSNWRSNITVVGGVVAGLLVALWFSSVVAAMGKPSGSVYPDYEQQHRQAKDRETHRWMRGLKDYPPAEAYQPDCPEDNKRHECFLLWRSARAAEVQARAAVDQANWARWSFWFLVATFFATAFAARYAYKAADATHRGANADEDSAVAANATLLAMEATGERQLRAYVNGRPKAFGLDGNRKRFTAIFSIRNSGTTPAYRLRNEGRVEIHPYPLPDNFTFPEPEMKNASVSIVHADEPAGAHQGFGHSADNLDQNLINEACAGKTKRFYLFGYIEYMDAFNKRRTTRLCYSIAPLAENFGYGEGKNSLALGWEASAQGNEAD
jgi:hypothetical protein